MIGLALMTTWHSLRHGTHDDMALLTTWPHYHNLALIIMITPISHHPERNKHMSGHRDKKMPENRSRKIKSELFVTFSTFVKANLKIESPGEGQKNKKHSLARRSHS